LVIQLAVWRWSVLLLIGRLGLVARLVEQKLRAPRDDFPTAGYIYGTSGIRAALHTALIGIPSALKRVNFALTLEYLEAAFYAEAVSKGALKGETAKYAKVVSMDEAQHVAFLKTALGMHAVKKPAFDFKGTTANQATFQKTAMALEDTGVAAYAGQGPNILQRPVVKAALSIHSVEARHAAWIRYLAGQTPAAAVVRQQARAIGIRDARESVEDRHGFAVEVELGARRRTLAGDDEAVHALRQQRLHVLPLARRIARGGAEENRDPRLVQRVLDAFENRHGEPAVPVGGDEADREVLLSR
jgi:hypothetical protein